MGFSLQNHLNTQQALMQKIRVVKRIKKVEGTVQLDGSKSLSNRALMLRALSKSNFKIENLSTSKDTQTLVKLLLQEGDIYDAGHAGTTFRFMTALLAFKEGTQTLTGSERMKQRPIGALVNALNSIGANIEYLENEGFPPLKIGTPNDEISASVNIDGSISSQYISALIMIAPTLPLGLEIRINEKLVSRPYTDMTLRMLNAFGGGSNFQENVILIPPQTINNQGLTIESDWSAASYYYAILALSDGGKILLKGLQKDSWQGDSILAEMMEIFGIQTQFMDEGIFIKRTGAPPRKFETDLEDCPDLAQTIAVICAGLGIEAYFTGLSTLKIKETNRIAALQNELGKIGVKFEEVGTDRYRLSGKATFEETPTFSTYQDHRMAMAFAPLGLLHPIYIEEPNVVVKSYGNYWKDLEVLGFEIEEVD